MSMEKRDTGKTQRYARYLNNRLVMRELRENGPCSATMLASKLNLSNAALSAIIEELRHRECIKESAIDVSQTRSGRRPIYWSINGNYGCIVTICLSDYVARVVISGVDMHITDSVETHVEKYDVAMLYELALTVKDLLNAEKYRNVPLKRIAFSLPGRVDVATGELMLSSQFDREIFSEKNFIVNLFERKFGAPVVLDNDINLAALGEMHNGMLKDIDNCMLLHVDEGIGGALILGGKLYGGQRGFAGEVGLIGAQFDGKSGVLDEFVSIRAIREHFDGGDIFALYRTDGEERKYILETAKCLGTAIKSLVEVLDISTIVLSGSVLKFGAEYINTLNAKLDGAVSSAHIYPSKLGADASVYGAIRKSVDALADSIFMED